MMRVPAAIALAEPGRVYVMPSRAFGRALNRMCLRMVLLGMLLGVVLSGLVQVLCRYFG